MAGVWCKFAGGLIPEPVHLTSACYGGHPAGCPTARHSVQAGRVQYTTEQDMGERTRITGASATQCTCKCSAIAITNDTCLWVQQVEARRPPHTAVDKASQASLHGRAGTSKRG